MDWERMSHPVALAGGLVSTGIALWVGAGAVVQTLLVLMALDVAGGVLVAWKHGNLRSDFGCEGLRRKAHSLLLVFGIWWLQRAVNTPLPASDSLAGMLAVMEFVSLAEKGPMLGARYPRPLVQGLAKVREWLESDATAKPEQGKTSG